ncbi:putative aldouronate transport system permease protein [Mobilisporobacter senegalensis]|uniref:Putative aldouronate transport system permease protein n=1 Tax=Mobilisporobacter senegalensis TaxID=1329262 RepID=A0A3N1XUU2_9FIRM|nr:carbohydrate ABC transporter permease [Mobilisporobacter senegalensis]ROR30389.1 putative aldouronate transport system permease protein [Mobilisporobacter senegalensis]
MLFRKRKKSIKDRVVDGLIICVLLLIVIVTIYPFLNVLAISFNDANDTIKGGIHIFPRVFTLRNYEEVFKDPILITAFINSVIRTILGAGLGVISTMMVSYVISRKDFFARKVVANIFAVTMYISGGMIPEFLLMKEMGMINSFTVYILPGIIGVYYIYIVRSFIDGLPSALQEAACIDGANDLQIFTRIILPLCKPVMATIGLYYAVSHWNSWFDTYIYNSSDSNLTTLQYELMKVLNNSNTAASGQMLRMKQQAQTVHAISPQSIRMAITIVATVPILVVYPFVQKYFVQGMTLGAVKD